MVKNIVAKSGCSFTPKKVNSGILILTEYHDDKSQIEYLHQLVQEAFCLYYLKNYRYNTKSIDLAHALALIDLANYHFDWGHFAEGKRNFDAVFDSMQRFETEVEGPLFYTYGRYHLSVP